MTKAPSLSGPLLLAFPLLASLLLAPLAAQAEEKRFGAWTSGLDMSVPGERLCWLRSNGLVFVIWAVEETGYRAEWLTRDAEEVPETPSSFVIRIDTEEFSGEDSVSGSLVADTMKAGLHLDYEYQVPSGKQSGSVSLIGFTKGYRYCAGKITEIPSEE